MAEVQHIMNALLKVTYTLAAMLVASASAAVFAAEVTSSTVTTVSKPSSLSITTNAPTFIIPGPSFQQPNVIQSVIVPVPGFVTTTAQIVGIKLYKPDDLLARRDGLVARICVERDAGTISSSEANDLLTRIQNVDSTEASMKASGMLTFREVKKLYGRYDKIGSDLDYFSTDHKKVIAGSYLVL
jgi:hypothetical protein